MLELSHIVAAGPLAIGLSSISAGRFAALNLVAAALWAIVVGGLGFAFGNAMEMVLGRLAVWEHRLLAAGAIGLTGFGLLSLVRRHLRRRAKPTLPTPGA